MTINSISFTNLERLRNAITQMGPEGTRVAGIGLRAEAQEVLARSRDLVPVDTGALKNSGRVRPEVGVYSNGNSMEVWITYGGSAVDYGIYVHEDLEARHVHGQAKYLEVPLIQQSYGLVGRLADRVESALKRKLRDT